MGRGKGVGREGCREWVGRDVREEGYKGVGGEGYKGVGREG